MTHFEHLLRHIPSLANAKILDLGSGKGSFLIDAAKHGADAQGLEYSQAYIDETHARAKKAGVHVSAIIGRAEELPFPDGSFDFVNIGEVIEHVDSPAAMLAEVRRVLRPDGRAYLSVPNRFGLKDQHFHLYFVNWLPRAWSDAFISIFGKHKDYADGSAGRQRLSDMHYYTYNGIRAFLASAGFEAEDMRQSRITQEYRGIKRTAASVVYPLVRDYLLDSFHLLISAQKPSQE